MYLVIKWLSFGSVEFIIRFYFIICGYWRIGWYNRWMKCGVVEVFLFRCWIDCCIELWSGVLYVRVGVVR